MFLYNQLPYGDSEYNTGVFPLTNGFVGGRNGLPESVNTRNLVRGFESITETIFTTSSVEGNVVVVPKIAIDVPYMLYPEDRLIIGWQCAYVSAEQIFLTTPTTFNMTSNPVYIGPELTINAGPAKVTLYGSKISNGAEVHDTLNQLLISNNVTEVIE